MTRAATGLERFFGAVVTSFDVGHDKPHPAVFNRALRSLDCPAHEAAMVGNDVVVDIAGAASLGMTTVLVARDPALLSPTEVTPTFTVSSLVEIPALLLGIPPV